MVAPIARFSKILPLVRSAQCLIPLLALVLSGCALQSPLTVRYPIKSGSWYNHDPQKLEKNLNRDLDKAGQGVIVQDHVLKLTVTNPFPRQTVLAVIAPHAAYRFSGVAAAHAFKFIQGRKFGRVFILGPKHKDTPSNAVLPTADTFTTPLGKLSVDTEAVKQLLKPPLFIQDEGAHQIEYSIEMELPFLQRVLGENTKIVPILIGNPRNIVEAQAIADAIRSILKPDDLVIVSSNFTHYGAKYNYEPFRDNIAANIQNLDKQAFSTIAGLDPDGLLIFKRQSGDHICGIQAIYILLKMLPRSTQVTLLDYYTSQAIKGGGSKPKNGKPWSVSYMAIGFTGDAWNTTPGATSGTAPTATGTAPGTTPAAPEANPLAPKKLQ